MSFWTFLGIGLLLAIAVGGFMVYRASVATERIGVAVANNADKIAPAVVAASTGVPTMPSTKK